MKKTGDAAKLVDRAETVAQTKQGVVGIKVAILAPGVKMPDQITVDEELLEAVRKNATFEEVEETVIESTETNEDEIVEIVEVEEEFDDITTDGDAATSIQTKSVYADNLDLDTEAGFDTATVSDDILDFTESNPFGDVK